MGWIVLGVLAVLAMWAVGVYNGLIGSRNGYKNAFSQIDVQLQRRNDLIPNLVETAKGYMKHESTTLEAVIAARNSAHSALKAAQAAPGDPSAMKQLSGAEAALGGVMTRFMAVAEAYPDLKANQNMMRLSEELSSTENRIAVARQDYNDAVVGYNNSREMFPGSIVANLFAFSRGQLWEIEKPEMRASPKLSFN